MNPSAFFFARFAPFTPLLSEAKRRNRLRAVEKRRLPDKERAERL
jgi:hypothetical protein